MKRSFPKITFFPSPTFHTYYLYKKGKKSISSFLAMNYKSFVIILFFVVVVVPPPPLNQAIFFNYFSFITLLQSPPSNNPFQQKYSSAL